jgi:hypothetical protein
LLSDSRGGCFQHLARASRQNNVCAQARQTGGDGGTNAASGSGYDRDLTG